MDDEARQLPNATPEQRLWWAVLLRAIDDARGEHLTGVTKESTRRKVREDALLWLRDGGRDFVEVCWWAGVDPEYVQRLFGAALVSAPSRKKRAPRLRRSRGDGSLSLLDLDE